MCIRDRILYLAGEKRDVVPAIVGPERSNHGGRCSSHPANDTDSFASSVYVCHAEVGPVAAAIEEGTESETQQQQHLHAGEHARDGTAETHRGTINERSYENGCQSNDLESSKRERVSTGKCVAQV